MDNTKISKEEVFSLDYTICDFMIPRLEKFREVCGGFPMNLTSELWDEILSKMIYSFKYAYVLMDYPGEMSKFYAEQLGISYDENNFTLYTEENYDKYKEGMELFSKYFIDLWY